MFAQLLRESFLNLCGFSVGVIYLISCLALMRFKFIQDLLLLATWWPFMLIKHVYMGIFSLLLQGIFSLFIFIVKDLWDGSRSLLF